MDEKEKAVFPPEVTRAFFLKMAELADRSPPSEVVQALHKKLIGLLGGEEALARVYQKAVAQLFEVTIWPPPEPAPGED